MKTQQGDPQRQQHMGEAVRRLRDGQHLSLRRLAAKCGLSASFISQVEMNKISPSLASLKRITSGLSVTLSQFFVITSRPGASVIKASHRPRLHSMWPQSQIECLGPPDGRGTFEMLMITIRPGGCSGTGLHSRETEICAFVFSGKIRLQLGETSHILCRGDLIAIPAGTLHRWENMAGKASQLLMIAARSVR